MMKLFKKFAFIGVSLLLLAAMAACGNQGTTTTQTAAGGRPTTPNGRLVVGANAMNGDMFDGWTNLVANADVKALTAGYSTVIYTEDDLFVLDPVVVKNFSQSDNADGGKTYTFEINDNLTYNDGTKITAKDYMFAMLFDNSKEMRELGARRYVGGEDYYGFDEYHSGATNIHQGGRLLGEYSFSIRVKGFDADGDPLYPFWYEPTYYSIGPLPMHVLAPGCDVVDRGTGVEITGPWSTDLVRSTVDNGSTGYRYNPKVTSGPYQFVSYDANNSIITLEVNDRYLGRGAEKTKPMIKQVVYAYTTQATEIDMLASGQVDFLIQISGATSINAGLDLVDSGKVSSITYARNGYGRITFHCDWGPTQFPAVRRAIAWCIDRQEFARQYTGGFGVVVDTRVGNGQWMLQANKAALDRDLTVYSLNVARAREELVADGWTLNATGGAYVEGQGIRHKRMPDGSLMALVVEWFSPDSNPIGEMLGTFIDPNAAAIGMQINHDWGDTVAFGNALYGEGTKRYSMINGGVGFATADSPWYYYVPDPDMFGSWNTNFIMDPELNGYTQQMRNTTPGDTTTYSRHWLNFVKRFNEVLPDIPLYSDEYYDFFNAKLKGYDRGGLYPWYFAMLKAWVEE